MNKSELLAKAKPILFNTPMVQAILDDRKTVTRRVIKYPSCGYFEFEPPRVKEPYHFGDILYVRETWHKYTKRVGKGESCRLEQFYGYKASVANSEDSREKWRPSIHMPKEAARIFLRVTDVSVERLQECGKGWCIDIEKEGVTTPQNPILYINDDAFHNALREEFQKLWDSTIKKTGLDRYGWNANPWVWVVEFERLEVEE